MKFRACNYLELHFTKPTSNREYIKMLRYLDAHPYSTRKQIQHGIGYTSNKNWEYFQAMTEMNFIKNVSTIPTHIYVITNKGKSLLNSI